MMSAAQLDSLRPGPGLDMMVATLSGLPRSAHGGFPAVSTDPPATRALLQHLRRSGYETFFDLVGGQCRVWGARGYGEARGATAALAVCRAVVKLKLAPVALPAR